MEELNEEVKQFLTTVFEKNSKPTDDSDEFMELIKYSTKVYTTIVGHHRWYDDELNVVKIDGKYIGYLDYYMTGDACAYDMDLHFDWSSVAFYESYPVTKTEYRPITTK